MEFLQRKLDILARSEKKSLFLLGARGCGKSSLLRQTFKKNTLYINLLQGEYYLRLSSSPQLLKEYIQDSKFVIIDEIQRIPELLNEVHWLIEEKGIKFILTGSSARNLRAKGVNLLAGRAWTTYLFPFSYSELNEKFNLERYLLYGGIPRIYLSEFPEDELDAYVSTYLKEEIQLEGLVRKISSFNRFLEVAAISNGQIINYSNIASDSEVSASTVRDHYQILEDTLIGFNLPAYRKTIKRKAIQSGKFFFFDIGVANWIAQRKVFDEKSDSYGTAFEHFIGMELRSFLSYQNIKQKPLTYWRSVNGQEVDFLIGNDIAIEVKSTKKISNKHLKGLKALKEEDIFKHYYLISQDNIETTTDGIVKIHWENFLKKLWGNKIL